MNIFSCVFQDQKMNLCLVKKYAIGRRFEKKVVVNGETTEATRRLPNSACAGNTGVRPQLHVGAGGICWERFRI